MIRACIILTGQVVVSDRELDKALKEQTVVSTHVHPDVFKRIMCFEESFIIELADTLCKAFDVCPGVSVRYAERYGLEELKPFLDDPLPWWF